MEKFREIEVDIQNKINEIIGIDGLFDDYVKQRNDYDKDVFNGLINNNAKLSNRIDKAIEELTFKKEFNDVNEMCLFLYNKLRFVKNILVDKNNEDRIDRLKLNGKVIGGEDNE